MPIIDLQRRARELGRIRIGEVVPTSSGKTRPAKLDRFRITSASRHLLDRIAELYGGDVREWTPLNSQLAQWEVYTESTRLPVLVPPQPLTQWYELWSGGGCQRRCDGVREVLKDQPCICGPDPADRTCKPTTRLNVVLREVEGIGVFRLETHGYYAAVELPMAAELLAAAGGYIAGHLSLEERVVIRDGKTNRFMVPTLDVDMTPGQLLANGGAAAIGNGAAGQLQAVPARQALPPAAGEPQLDVDNVRAAIDAVTTLDDLRALWPDARKVGLEPYADQRAKQIKATAQPAARETPAEDPNAVWSLVLQSVPEDWTTEQVERDFGLFAEVPAEQASAADIRRYLDALPERVRAAS